MFPDIKILNRLVWLSTPRFVYDSVSYVVQGLFKNMFLLTLIGFALDLNKVVNYYRKSLKNIGHGWIV